MNEWFLNINYVTGLTLFPVMRGPGETPLTTTAARVKPSGAMSASDMIRSAVGPMAAYAEVEKRRVR